MTYLTSIPNINCVEVHICIEQDALEHIYGKRNEMESFTFWVSSISNIVIIDQGLQYGRSMPMTKLMYRPT